MKKPSSTKSTGSSSSSSSSGSAPKPGHVKIRDMATGKKVHAIKSKYVIDALTGKRVLRKNALPASIPSSGGRGKPVKKGKGKKKPGSAIATASSSSGRGPPKKIIKWYSKTSTRKMVRDGKKVIPRTSTPIPESFREDYYTWAVNFLFEHVITEQNTQKMFVKLYHFVLTLLINLSFSGFLKFISFIQIARRLKYYKDSLDKSQKLRERFQFVSKWLKWLYFATRSRDTSYAYTAPQKSPSVGNFDRVKHSSQKRIDF